MSYNNQSLRSVVQLDKFGNFIAEWKVNEKSKFFESIKLYNENGCIKYTEVNLYAKWLKVAQDFVSAKHMNLLKFNKLCKQIIRDFDQIPLKDITKPRVGIVGEILVKFSPAGNNYLVDLLESEGAEAVVPLDQNEKWINKVAMDMNAAVGGGNNEKLQEIVELLKSLIEMFPETMIDAFKSMKFDVNNREFARLVKAVN